MDLKKDEIEIRRLCAKYNITPPYGKSNVIDTFRDLVERTCQMMERTEKLEQRIYDTLADIRRRHNG